MVSMWYPTWSIKALHSLTSVILLGMAALTNPDSKIFARTADLYILLNLSLGARKLGIGAAFWLS